MIDAMIAKSGRRTSNKISKTELELSRTLLRSRLAEVPRGTRFPRGVCIVSDGTRREHTEGNVMKRKARKSTRRSSWKGQLRFGLVSVGVEAVNARSKQGGDIHFHLLHDKCHRRVRYEKVCPVHGEVSNDEIVSGYEYSKGKYVEIEPEELDELRSEQERSLTIDSFISPEELDPIYFDGRMYYLLPSDNDANAAYQVLTAALEHQQRWGVGHLVMSGKDQVVAIRPDQGVLHMAMLNYASEIRPAKELLPRSSSKPSARQVKLAETLIKSWDDEPFDFESYEDRYRNRLAELIEDKVAGKETVAPAKAEEEEPQVINFIDALQKSLKSRSRSSTKPRSSQPRKRKRKKRAS